MRLAASIPIVLATLSFAGVARAQADILSPDTLHGLVDFRLSAADGEPSFSDGGYGKTRYGGDAQGDYRARLQVAEAALEWRPRLNWAWSAVVDVTAQPGQEHPVDLSQAYAVFKPVPRSDTRLQARFGLFYPPVSLEHDAPVWGVTNTITPSAINSWIGEEVKVVGAELQVSHDFGDQQVSLTGAVFGFDDTAGTLLTYRGWALHDLKSTANGSFPLPPLSPFAASVQDQETYSQLEIDHRAGYYIRAEWRPTDSFAVHVFHYDNRGDKEGVTPDLQWAWETRFTEIGAALDAGPHTRVLAQAVVGRTRMGFPTGDGLFADVSFHAAYALISHDLGRAAVTARIDGFDAVDHSLVVIDNNDEHGWALTGAWRLPLSKHADLRLEALKVWSNRPSRTTAAELPTQAQTVLQSSLRLSF
jgi:hypothetical protein